MRSDQKHIGNNEVPLGAFCQALRARKAQGTLPEDRLQVLRQGLPVRFGWLSDLIGGNPVLVEAIQGAPSPMAGAEGSGEGRLDGVLERRLRRDPRRGQRRGPGR